MKTRLLPLSFLPGAVLLLVLITGALLATGALAGKADTEAGPPSRPGWLSIAQIHERLVGAGYHDIEKIERKDGYYKVRAHDRLGQRLKLQVHPQTGEIIDPDSRAIRRTAPQAHNRSAARECNKRRCRDDLPSSPPPVAPAVPGGRS